MRDVCNKNHRIRITYDFFTCLYLSSFVFIILYFASGIHSRLPVHDTFFFLMLFPNNSLGAVEPWLSVKAHCGGGDGGKGGGLVGSACLPSCLAAHSGLIAQVPHTSSLTHCSVVVCAVRLMHTTVFYTQRMAVMTG